jgi:hypothetical protein
LYHHFKILLNICDIAVLEFDLPIGFIPFEWHGSTAGKQKEHIGGVIVEKLLEGIYKAIAKTKKGNKDEDTQSYRKARQKSPEFVFTDGFEYFIPCIPAKHIPMLYVVLPFRPEQLRRP